MFHNLSWPPTIAATRSRRSIKPNPKYTSDDMIDLVELTEDDDDELADAAFNPQLYNSDDDDMSEGEFEEEQSPPKLPPVKRKRGRPPKASTLANTAGSSVGSTTVVSKMGASSGRPTPSSLQQLLRNDNDSPVARKSYMGVSGHRSTKMGQLGRMPRNSSVTFKINTSSGNRSVPRSRSAGSACHGGALSKPNKSDDEDDVPTFTIVNIDDIINQEDVLISRANINIAAATAAVANFGSATGKKRGRPRTRGIPPSSNAVDAHAPRLGFSLRSVSLPKRGKVSIKYNPGYNQNNIPMKPPPRILNTEMGKKAQNIKPLLNMDKELRPMPIDTEKDELEPDLDFDNYEPSTSTPLSASAGKRNGSSKNNNNSNNRQNILSTASASSVNARPNLKLSTLLVESGSGELTLYKKPGISIKRRGKENHPQEDDLKDSGADVGGSETHKSTTNSSGSSSSHSKYFPPETTTFCEEDGRVVKKITCYETWHVIIPAGDSQAEQQRTFLRLALVKLANATGRIKVPSSKWTSKITLNKVSPTLMQRQTMTIFTGDLKAHNIPEEERDKYQPSCVTYLRSALDTTKCRGCYDRSITFKNKWFYSNIDGRHVNLLGAPELVDSLKDVEILLDILEHLTLDSQLVEIVSAANGTGRDNN